MADHIEVPCPCRMTWAGLSSIVTTRSAWRRVTRPARSAWRARSGRSSASSPCRITSMSGMAGDRIGKAGNDGCRPTIATHGVNGNDHAVEKRQQTQTRVRWPSFGVARKRAAYAASSSRSTSRAIATIHANRSGRRRCTRGADASARHSSGNRSGSRQPERHGRGACCGAIWWCGSAGQPCLNLWAVGTHAPDFLCETAVWPRPWQ